MRGSKRGRGLFGLPKRFRVLAILGMGALWVTSAPWSLPAWASGSPLDDEAAVVVAGAPAGSDALLAATLEAPPQEEEHAEEEGGATATQFFLILISILVAAKLMGELAERMGQPAVLGELVAGVLLGASVLGIVPAGGEMAEIIHLLAEVGVAILLFEIGLETDLKEMFRVGAAASTVAAVGVAFPFLFGFLYWFLAEPSIMGSTPGVSPTMVAVFVGATLTATSVGITARVLTDLKMMHRAESRVIIGAAVIDDVLGLVILAIVSSLAAGATVTLLGMGGRFLVAVGFLVVAVMVGNILAPRLFTLIDRMRVRGVLLVSAFCFALLFAALADLAGSAMIIGAFAAGLVLSTTNQFDLIVERIEPVADIFTPIFFVSVGAAVDIRLFIPGTEVFNLDVIIVGAILIVGAVFGKVVAGYSIGWAKTSTLNRLAIGVGMVPRGEVGLIFADIGRRTGILSPEVFSAILIMVIFTTFITPPLLKVVFKPTEPSAPAPAGHRDSHGLEHPRGAFDDDVGSSSIDESEGQ